MSVSVSLGVGVPADRVGEGEALGDVEPVQLPWENDAVMVTVTKVPVADLEVVFDDDDVKLMLLVGECDGLLIVGEFDKLELVLGSNVGECADGDVVAADRDNDGEPLLLREGLSVAEPILVPTDSDPVGDMEDETLRLNIILVSEMDSDFECADETDGVLEGTLAELENVDDASSRLIVFELVGFGDSDCSRDTDCDGDWVRAERVIVVDLVGPLRLLLTVRDDVSVLLRC